MKIVKITNKFINVDHIVMIGATPGAEPGADFLLTTGKTVSISFETVQARDEYIHRVLKKLNDADAGPRE